MKFTTKKIIFLLSLFKKGFESGFPSAHSGSHSTGHSGGHSTGSFAGTPSTFSGSSGFPGSSGDSGSSGSFGAPSFNNQAGPSPSGQSSFGGQANNFGSNGGGCEYWNSINITLGTDFIEYLFCSRWWVLPRWRLFSYSWHCWRWLPNLHRNSKNFIRLQTTTIPWLLRWRRGSMPSIPHLRFEHDIQLPLPQRHNFQPRTSCLRVVEPIRLQHSPKFVRKQRLHLWLLENWPIARQLKRIRYTKQLRKCCRWSE